MLSFKQFYSRVQNFIGDDSTTTLAIIKETVNLKARDLLQKGFMPFLLRETTITTASGTSDYALPYDFGKVISLTQHDTPAQLRATWIGDFDRVLPYPTAKGKPTHYMTLLQNKVLAQPSASAKVVAKSTSVQDIAAQDGAAYATVYGVAGGVDRSEVLTLSATNVVCSTLSYTKLYAIGADDEPTGTLYFTQAVAGTELLLLYPNTISFDYQTLKLYPQPDSAYTLYLKYIADQPWLVNDSDLFIIPGRYINGLMYSVVAEMLASQGNSKAAYYEKKAEIEIDQMLKEQDRSWDYTPTVKYADDAVVDYDYPFVNL